MIAAAHVSGVGFSWQATVAGAIIAFLAVAVVRWVLKACVKSGTEALVDRVEAGLGPRLDGIDTKLSDDHRRFAALDAGQQSIREQLAVVQHEVTYNNGSSLKDAVRSMRQAANDVDAETKEWRAGAAEHREAAVAATAALDAKVDSLAASIAPLLTPQVQVNVSHQGGTTDAI